MLESYFLDPKSNLDELIEEFKKLVVIKAKDDEEDLTKSQLKFKEPSIVIYDILSLVQ
jgi:hypothetical protein